ncbi:MAG: hypothetical protein MK086_03085, partial [Flavobacteriales bacterium]|nr:hypothetical protein [Flavobacteriales bacterium]
MGQTKMTGTCPDWVGQVVELSYTSNPFSAEKTILDIDTVDASGKFEFTCQLEDVQQVWIRVNRF